MYIYIYIYLSIYIYIIFFLFELLECWIILKHVSHWGRFQAAAAIYSCARGLRAMWTDPCCRGSSLWIKNCWKHWTWAAHQNGSTGIKTKNEYTLTVKKWIQRMDHTRETKKKTASATRQIRTWLAAICDHRWDGPKCCRFFVYGLYPHRSRTRLFQLFVGGIIEHPWFRYL